MSGVCSLSVSLNQYVLRNEYEKRQTNPAHCSPGAVYWCHEVQKRNVQFSGLKLRESDSHIDCGTERCIGQGLQGVESISLNRVLNLSRLCSETHKREAAKDCLGLWNLIEISGTM